MKNTIKHIYEFIIENILDKILISITIISTFVIEYLKTNIPFTISLFLISILIYFIFQLYRKNIKLNKQLIEYTEYDINFIETLQDGTEIKKGSQIQFKNIKGKMLIALSFNKKSKILKYIDDKGLEKKSDISAFECYKWRSPIIPNPKRNNRY